MNVTSITKVTTLRRYALVAIKGKTQLACFTEDGWEIDATCESINDLLTSGLVSEDAITGWIERRALKKH